jgi:hypothetical protein
MGGGKAAIKCQPMRLSIQASTFAVFERRMKVPARHFCLSASAQAFAETKD